MDLINDFILDYMHLVCLGVVRRLLYFLKGQVRGTNVGKLSASSRKTISDRLDSMNGLLSSEFARQPRSLQYLDRWKATEFRTFLLYTGLVVLKNVVSSAAYKHFLSLSIAVRILCCSSRSFRQKYINFAERLLRYFVGNAPEHYGHIFNVYNVHGLLHIAEDVRCHSLPLDAISAFPFENYLGKLKRLARGRKSPLVQIVRRIGELEVLDKVRAVTSHKLCAQSKNSHFLTDNGIVYIRHLKVDGRLVCDFYEKTVTKNYFTEFLESKKLDIHFVSDETPSSIILLQRKDLKTKCICLPCKRGKVIFPLLHESKQ